MTGVDIETSIGYTLKRVTAALRAAMAAALDDLGLTVSQYATLELLAQRPDISNADLARGTFVSRQATHQLLAGLRSRGLVASTGSGRDQRNHLTADGAAQLRAASEAVADVERRMLGPLDDRERAQLFAALGSCAEALGA